MDRSVILQSAALLVGALVGLVVAWYRPRAALRRRARAVRGTLPAAVADLDGRAGEPIVLAGTLVSLSPAPAGAARGPLLITALPRGAELLAEPTSKAVTVGADLGLRLDATTGALPGPVVAIEGRAQVLVGSLDTGRAAPSERARGWLPGLAHAALPGAEVTLRALSAGDRVLAAGVLRAIRAGDTAADYRGRAAAHVLVPQVEGAEASGVVALVFAGAPRPLGGRVMHDAVHALAGVAAVAALVGAVRAVPVAVVPPRLPEDVCPADLDARMEAGDASSAAESAEACGDDLRAARARWLLADFDRASRALLRARRADRALPPSPTEVTAHLLAGHPDLAAAAARDLAERGGLDAPKRKILGCLADALDHRAGDRGAQGRLLGGVAAHPVCALLLADTLDGEARLAALPSPRTSDYSWGPPEVAAAFLRREVNHTEHVKEFDFYVSGALRGARGIVLPQPLGLIDAGRGSLGARENWTGADLDLLIALFHSYLGEHADAAVDLRRALARNAFVDPDLAPRARAGDVFQHRPPRGDSAAWRAHLLDGRRDFFFAALLATRAREVANARAYLALAPEESFGASWLEPVLAAVGEADPAALGALRAREGWAPFRRVWDGALTGDPEKLVTALRETRGDGRAVIPFLPSAAMGGSAALGAWVAGGYPPGCWTCGLNALVNHTAGRREVADALGERALAGQLRAPLLRMRDALLRRDLAVPLLALGQVTGP